MTDIDPKIIKELIASGVIAEYDVSPEAREKHDKEMREWRRKNHDKAKLIR